MQAWWAKCCLQICSKGPFAKASRIYDLVTIDDVAADGTIRARLRVNEGVAAVEHRLHCGAAALIVDELTTASIISQRSVAGVSISMSLTFCAEAAVGSVVHIESKVVRLGRRLVHTEATFTLADGTPVLRASHLKFCEATWAWLPIVWIRTALARRLAPLLAKPAPLRSELAAASPPSLPALDDRQKSAYFGELGDTADLQGFDVLLRVAGLRRPHEGSMRFVLSQPRSVANPAGALHGACTAAIFDAVATAAVARRKDSSVGVGVTTQLSVMYGVAGAGRITFSTELLHSDHVTAVVAVDARDEKDRVVARGTVVKRVSAYVDPPGGADLAPVMRV